MNYESILKVRSTEAQRGEELGSLSYSEVATLRRKLSLF
jgi:hypothetical protein